VSVLDANLPTWRDLTPVKLRRAVEALDAAVQPAVRRALAAELRREADSLPIPPPDGAAVDSPKE